jgi:hypothetical protein
MRSRGLGWLGADKDSYKDTRERRRRQSRARAIARAFSWSRARGARFFARVGAHTTTRDARRATTTRRRDGARRKDSRVGFRDRRGRDGGRAREGARIHSSAAPARRAKSVGDSIRFDGGARRATG